MRQLPKTTTTVRIRMDGMMRNIEVNAFPAIDEVFMSLVRAELFNGISKAARPAPAPDYAVMVSLMHDPLVWRRT